MPQAPLSHRHCEERQRGSNSPTLTLPRTRGREWEGAWIASLHYVPLAMTRRSRALLPLPGGERVGVRGTEFGIRTPNLLTRSLRSRPLPARGERKSNLVLAARFSARAIPRHSRQPSPPIEVGAPWQSCSRQMPVETFANAASARMTERRERKERNNERKNRRRNADRRNSYSAVPETGTAAPWIAKAHIYRRSTAVLAPRSLSSARD